MIPKIIHYCWFGEKELPQLTIKCIESWKKYFPGWEICLWNEKNAPLHLPYLQKAYEQKKWANLSNYTRLHALYYNGGIYFDTDVEVIKSFDFINNYDCFVGFESADNSNVLSVNNAIIGAKKEHPFVYECLGVIKQDYNGTEEAYLSSPVLTTNLLQKNGLNKYAEQDIYGVHIFTREVFYPYSWTDVFTFSSVKENTYAIHYWDISWKNSNVELKKLITQLQNIEDASKKKNDIIRSIFSGKLKFVQLAKINVKYLMNKIK
ncbi:glycosyltransferase [Segetibacter koreensis]|uniref:glycosyltransferase n=1 Tax=Segetibacter koreensis TaxID=398037 RepID=UPI0003790725|nr:glycosyltransferase [Segetibacter koreensis]